MEADLIDAPTVKKHYPLLDVTGVLGALWLPNDSYVDPSQTTHAYARRARANGAKIVQQCPVLEIIRKPDGTWRLITSKGHIDCEYVVNCAGVWAAEISAMVKGVLPSVGVNHQMLITESIPEIEELDFELPMLHDFNVPFYTRSDRKGLIVSCYWDRPKIFGDKGTPPPDFGQELLPPDLDSAAEEKLARVMEMIPALGRVGVRTVVNGPVPRSGDRIMNVGPAHGYHNYFVFCSNYGGFQFSSLGRNIAEWIVEGAPSVNLSELDVRRHGDYSNRNYNAKRVVVPRGVGPELPSHYPYDESEALRPVWTSPLYGVLKGRGAVFGAINGWEVANWYATPGNMTNDIPSFLRANWFERVGEEFNALKAGVGMIDLTFRAKFEVRGENAGRDLDALIPAELPKLYGVCTTPVLNRFGGVAALWTVSRPNQDVYYVTADGSHAQRDLDILSWGVGAASEVVDVTRLRAVIALAGPLSEEVLKIAGWEQPDGADRLLSEDTQIGWIPVRILRLAWGDVPVWELHTATECQVALYEYLMKAGAALDIRDVGIRAVSAATSSAGMPRFGVDIFHGAHPGNVGFESLLGDAKAAFVGKSAVQGSGRCGRRVVRIKVDIDGSDAKVEPWGDEPLMCSDQCVGYVTSATPDYGTGKATGFALLDPDRELNASGYWIQILGEKADARLLPLAWAGADKKLTLCAFNRGSRRPLRSGTSITRSCQQHDCTDLPASIRAARQETSSKEDTP